MINDIVNEARSKMKSTLHVFEEDLQGIRGGRASTSLVDRMMVDYYGQPTELRQLANISTPEAMQILIRPYDKSAMKTIEKAIQQSELGIHPNTDGDVIRLNMPPLTRERRQDLVKFLHKRMEEARVAIRNIRRAANDDLKEFEKEKLISEDEQERGEEEVQKLTDQFIAQIEEAGKIKEKDIMEL
jgi:ribosome recycling factor